YIIETSMPAFAPGIKEADVKDVNQPERLDFELVLLSRSQQAPAPARRRVGLRGQAAQRLAATQAESQTPAQEAANETPEQITSGELPAAEVAQDTPTESIAVLGNTAQTTFGNNFDFDRERLQQFIDERFGAPGGGQDGGPGNFNIPGPGG